MRLACLPNRPPQAPGMLTVGLRAKVSAASPVECSDAYPKQDPDHKLSCYPAHEAHNFNCVQSMTCDRLFTVCVIDGRDQRSP